MDELRLTDDGHRPDRESAVPGEESEEHADGTEISERRPVCRADVCRRSQVDRAGRRHRHDRQREHQGPTDGLPRAEFSRENAALGIADRAENHGAEQVDVVDAARRRSAVCEERERDRCDGSRGRTDPEPHSGTFAGECDRHDGGHRGKQSDDHRGVTGIGMSQGKRGEQRESDDDARGDRDQTKPLTGGGKAGARDTERDDGQRCRDDGPAASDEQRVESWCTCRTDGDAGQRHREGERGHPDEAPDQTTCRCLER